MRVSSRLGDALFALGCVAILSLFIGGIFWLAVAKAPPCTGGWSLGGQTGKVQYRGRTIECFHGDLVRVDHG